MFHRPTQFHPPISRALDTLRSVSKPESRCRGPKVAGRGPVGRAQKVNSRFWRLRRPIEASKPIGIALKHSATGTPRRFRGLFRQAQPTFLFKLDISECQSPSPGTENFFSNFLSDLPSEPSKIDSTGSNYPRGTLAGSTFAFPWPSCI